MRCKRLVVFCRRRCSIVLLCRGAGPGSSGDLHLNSLRAEPLTCAVPVVAGTSGGGMQSGFDTAEGDPFAWLEEGAADPIDEALAFASEFAENN